MNGADGRGGGGGGEKMRVDEVGRGRRKGGRKAGGREKRRKTRTVEFN